MSKTPDYELRSDMEAITGTGSVISTTALPPLGTSATGYSTTKAGDEGTLEKGKLPHKIHKKYRELFPVNKIETGTLVGPKGADTPVRR